MTDEGWVSNEISGGIFFAPVVLGRDNTVVLPPELHPALSGLPEESKVFAGRDKYLEELLALLAPATPDSPTPRVAAVAGLAGMGKTELVLQAAHAALRNGWFPGGVLFVDMFGYDPERRVEASSALESLLRAAGIPGEHIPAAVQDRSRLFFSVMARYAEEGKPVLVVVDNVASSAQARPLLPPVGKAIVTSRHTLADLEARLLELDALTAQAGVDLLAGQLNVARSGDTRVADHPDEALSIAWLCAGLPLALRIVAALLAAHPARTLSAMAADLHDARTRLNEMRYKGADEEVAVRSAFELSYRLLEPQQARTFCLLALNPGPETSTEAASALTALDQRTVRQCLEELARAHLLESGSTCGRWRMHDLLRLYAQELSEAYAQEYGREQAIDRMLAWYLRMARAADQHMLALPGAEMPGDHASWADALAWLDAERGALTGAVRMAADTGRDYVAMSLPLQTGRYFVWRHHFDDLLSTSEASVAAARRLGDRLNEAVALTNLGVALQDARRFDEAIDVLQQAATIYREAGLSQLVGGVLNNLGLALRANRRFGEAADILRQAVAIHQKAGDLRGEASALNSLGITSLDADQYQAAFDVAQKAAAICQRTGDRRSEAMAAGTRGHALLKLGQVNNAVAAQREAAAIYQEIGDRHGEGVAANSLGTAMQEAGQVEVAIALHQDAAEIYRQTRDRQREGIALLNLSAALSKAGQAPEAVNVSRNAVAIFHETGDRYHEGRAVGNLCRALTAAGRLGEAIEEFQGAREIYQESGDRCEEGRLLIHFGDALTQQSQLNALTRVPQLNEVIGLFREADAIFGGTGGRDEARLFSGVGIAFAYGARFDKAIEAFQRAAGLFQHPDEQDEKGRALANLGTTLAAAGRVDEAVDAYRTAADIFAAAGSQDAQDKTLEDLSHVLRDAGRPEEATAADRARAALSAQTGHGQRQAGDTADSAVGKGEPGSDQAGEG